MAFMGSGKVAEWLDLGKEAERRAGTIDDIGRKVAAMTVRSAAQNFYGTPLEAIATGEAGRCSGTRSGAIRAGSASPNMASAKPITLPAAIAKRNR